MNWWVNKHKKFCLKRFIEEQEASGLLSSLGIKRPIILP